MKKILIRTLALTLVLLPLLTALPFVSTGAKADAGGRVPYRYSLDSINGHTTGGTMIGVIRDLHLPLGESLKAEGWLATDEGVSRYEYLWLPAGGGTAVWQEITTASIISRPDLAAAGIPYQSGHGTAGFALTVDPPDHTPEGVYDVYLRAIDGMGVPCDMVALLGLRYGDPDIDDGERLKVSFPRLRREGDLATVGGPTVDDTGITLSGEQMVRLGNLNLAAFARLRITYEPEQSAPSEGRRPILGLKSAGQYGYGSFGDSYNMTHNLVYTALPAGSDPGTLDIDLTACDYIGEVWLTGYLDGSVRITEIEFTYNGYRADRVAAKINLSGDLTGTYFSSFNRVDVTGVADPVLGDVLRIEVKEETNDPYVHFNAGAVLRDSDIVLDADEYRYMVFLYRAEPHNRHKNTVLYLCAGKITGATEACTYGFEVVNDGKWHYAILDLTDEENWIGIINGWRFDILSGTTYPGEAMEFASVQFFRTYEAAKKAASADPMSREPFHCGDPAVLRDMSEEVGADEPDYVIPPEDCYVVTEPETEAPTEEPAETPSDTEEPAEPDTDSSAAPETASATEATTEPVGHESERSSAESVTTPAEPDTAAEVTLPSADTAICTDTAPTLGKQGCASALPSLTWIILTAMVSVFLKTINKRKGERYEE